MSEDNIEQVYIENARLPEQRMRMADIIGRGICFMCPEHLDEFFENDGNLLERGEYGTLVKNTYPYRNTQYHVMYLTHEHIQDFSEITSNQWEEARAMFQDFCEINNIKFGGVALRFGNPKNTGASAKHLHIHLIVPDENPAEKVRFKIS